MDAIVLARSGFHHSINYRAVMAFGRAHMIQETEQKLRAMDAFINRFFPGRAAALRPPNKQEIKATTLLGMEIEHASGKIRDKHVSDEEEDYAVPVWTALIPVKTVIEPAQMCPRPLPGLLPEAGGMAAYQPGRRLDEVVLEMHRMSYPD